MVSYTEIHDAPLAQLLRWWDGVDPQLADFEHGFLDEVAFALSKHRPDGIAALKRCLDSTDLIRRAAALNFLAYPGVADDEQVRMALVQAFFSGVRNLRYRALWGFIHLAYFPLAQQVGGLLGSADERMAALAMVYLSRASSAETIEILEKALDSTNPRMREYACDEIGDRVIVELSERMRALLTDPDEMVVESARCNLEFFN